MKWFVLAETLCPLGSARLSGARSCSVGSGRIKWAKVRAETARAVQQAFADAQEPKALRFFPGREHSRALLRGAHGDDAPQTIVSFVAEGLGTS